MAVPAERLEVVEREPLVDVSNMSPDELVTVAQQFRQDSLLADETRLSREEALERCLQPERQLRAGFIPERMSKLGDAIFAYVRPRTPFVLPQIRQEYSLPYISMLGKHIARPNGQIQNSTVAMFDDSTRAQRYIEDANEYFEAEISLGELWEIHKIGRTKVDAVMATVAGHTRQLAIGYNNKRHSGHSDKGPRALLVRVFMNPSFADMLEVQAAENSGLPPEPWERSRAIVKYIEMRSAEGNMPRTEDVAEMYNVDSDQIPRSIRYEQLPAAIKRLTEQDKLKFSGAFELFRLLDIYTEKDVIELAQKFADRKYPVEKIRKEVAIREVVRDLPDSIRVKVDNGLLSHTQAEVIVAMQEAGVSEEVTERLSEWIVLEQPSIDEVRTEGYKYIKAAQNGDRDIFNDHEATVEEIEERQVVADAYFAELAKGQRRQAASRFAKSAGTMLTALATGVIGMAADEKMLAAELSRVAGEVIGKLQAGMINPELIGTLSELLVQQQEKAVEPSEIEAIARLREVLETEAKETSHTQLARHIDAISGVISREPSDIQMSLM